MHRLTHGYELARAHAEGGVVKKLVEIGGVGWGVKVHVLSLNYSHFDLLDEGGL